MFSWPRRQTGVRDEHLAQMSNFASWLVGTPIGFTRTTAAIVCRSFPRDNDEHDGSQNEEHAQSRESRYDGRRMSAKKQARQDFQPWCLCGQGFTLLAARSTPFYNHQRGRLDAPAGSYAAGLCLAACWRRTSALPPSRHRAVRPCPVVLFVRQRFPRT